ncbi:hypothetical protein ACFPN1_12345 [Lysobacter yangpyeongensis]|uniref:Uncharacterized protein n=1 Tax=Lysobacter yangpyeongensis TaxID=346182 RepID=A0ABW0SQ77_9GAMM
MNARYVFLLAIALPATAAAAPPTPSPIVVDCAQRNWPSLERVAQETGLSAFDPVEHARKRAIVAGLRACRRGAGELLIVFESPRVQVRGMEVAQASAPR